MEYPQFDFKDTLIPSIGKTAKMMGIYLGRSLQQSQIDLTSKQWVLLKILHRQDGIPQNDLAVITERNKASLVRLIHNMERKGLVTRIQDPSDKRINRIFLTKRGKQIYQKTLPTIRSAFHEMQSGISRDEIDTVNSILDRILDNIRQQEQSCKSI